MTREEARRAIAIMQAYADGAVIQTRGRGERRWTDTVSPVFELTSREYRVKPEVRTLYFPRRYVSRMADGSGFFVALSTGLDYEVEGHPQFVKWIDKPNPSVTFEVPE